ncbi:MAG: FAD-dependent oxidoreductase [Desulfovibrio sp.]|nr:FAD-dependent oxidoreductase [Desulfovibrio sp.]
MLPVKPVMEADFLVVGGGIGGLMAAISAAKSGCKNVVILEKMNARRSGSGATGNDHFNCYIPEYHGDDIMPVFQQTLQSMVGAFKDPSIIYEFLCKSFDLVKMWEEWGINMRPTGKWECKGHALPGKARVFLKYDGSDQKKMLIKVAKQLGVKIVNHHTVVELAKVDGRIAGALALDISTPEPAFQPVRAKTVLLATGLTHRLYITATTPGYMFNTGHCPNCAGGQALGWRIGARMVNMEFPYTHAGPKYFGRCGKATWIGVYRYPNGIPVGPFTEHSDTEYGDVTSDIWNSVFEDVMLNGTGPAYMDCSDATEKQLEYMYWAMRGEGLTSLLNYMKDAHIDPKKDAVEFMRYEPILHGRGMDVSDEGETSVPGLFAAGDMVGNGGCGIALAAYMGWVGGQTAAEQAKEQSFQKAEECANIRERMELLSSFMERADGAEWKDANMGLQQIMSDYAPAGPRKVRSATLLNAGITYLGHLRAQTRAQLKASCAHTLMRAAEALDLMDCAEAILHAALARKETRALHVRSDYPFTNPLLADKFLTVGLENGKVETAWRPIRQAKIS